MEWDFLFRGWDTIWRTLVVGTLAYVAVVVMLRGSGKRTLAKMNGFDLVVTVAIGSTLATILLSRDVSLVQGVTAFALLIVLQWVVTWLSVRSDAVKKAVRAEPVLLFRRGAFLRGAMKRARVTESEILQAARSRGVLGLGSVEAVVLETNGDLSVLTGGDEPERSSLADVRGRGEDGTGIGSGIE